MVSSPLKELLSQIPFPIECSRNCLLDMENQESCRRLEWPVSGSFFVSLNDKIWGGSRPAASWRARPSSRH